MRWPTQNIGDLASVRTGKLDANASSESGEYPFFTCAKKPLKIDTYSYDCECVLVAGNGDLNVKHYKGKFDAYQRTYIIETAADSSSRLNTRYLYHFLETYLERLRELSIGGIIKYIKKGHLTEAKIPLPPLPEQKRIAKILDAADALRAKRRESLAQLDALLQSTFLEMFGDPVENPRAFEKVRLGDLLKVKSGSGLTSQDMSLGGEYPVYGGNGINGYHDSFMFEEPKLVLGRVGVYCGAVHLTQPKSWVTDNALYVAEIFRDINQTYLLHALSLANLNQYAGRAAQPLISGSRIYPVEITYPPMEQQIRFETRVKANAFLRKAHECSLSELGSFFASLQQRAFNGQL